jgi:hypothetical protein
MEEIEHEVIDSRLVKLNFKYGKNLKIEVKLNGGSTVTEGSEYLVILHCTL